MTALLSSPSPIGRVVGGLLRLVLALAGGLLMIGALLLGLLVAAGVVLWALLRGRRPAPVNLRWRAASARSAYRRAPAGDVIDVQAREIVEPR